MGLTQELAPYFWQDSDGDQGSVRVEEGYVVLEVQSRDRKNAEGVWLTKADAARLSAWLDQWIGTIGNTA